MKNESKENHGLIKRSLTAVLAGVRAFSTGTENPAVPQGMLEHLFAMMGGGGPSFSGQRVTPMRAMQTSAVYGCVRVLTTAIAGLPLGVYRRTSAQGQRRKEPAYDHPLYFLLHDEPNPEQTSFEWLETVVLHVLLRGRSYHFIEMNRAGWPVALWPIHPDLVTCRRAESGAIVYDVRQKDGGLHRYAASEILHFKGMSDDGLNGLNPLELHREQIGATRAADEYSGRFFANDGRPPGILSTEQPIGNTPEQAREIKARISEDWHERVGGENRHRVPVVDRGLKFQSIGINPEDSQMLETRRYNTADIARIYGVPLMLLMETEKSTSWGAGLEQQLVAFVTYSLRSWLVRFETTMRRSLMTPKEKRDHYIEFNVDGLLRGDIGSRYKAYSIGRVGGWLNVNEIRDKENMNPVDGGDVYLQPLNMDVAGEGREDETDGSSDTGSSSMSAGPEEIQGTGTSRGARLSQSPDFEETGGAARPPDPQGPPAGGIGYAPTTPEPAGLTLSARMAAQSREGGGALPDRQSLLV